MLNYFTRKTIMLVSLATLVGGCLKYQAVASKETIDKLAMDMPQNYLHGSETELPCTLTARAKSYECRLAFTNDIYDKITEYGLSEFCHLLGSHLVELMGNVGVPKSKVNKLEALRERYLLERAKIINGRVEEKPENNKRESPIDSKLAVVH